MQPLLASSLLVIALVTVAAKAPPRDFARGTRRRIRPHRAARKTTRHDSFPSAIGPTPAARTIGPRLREQGAGVRRRRAAQSPKEGPSCSGRAFLFLWTALLSAFPSEVHARQPVRSLAEIRQHNVVIQKWDLSCGAAALATLLTYDLGDPVGERAVAEAMLRRNDPLKVRVQGGFSLLDLQEYAERRGYQAEGYGQLSSRDLVGMLPAIVPIRIHGYDHFVVVRSVAAGRVHFADPAYGNRRLRLEAFDEAWMRKVAFVVSRAPR
jgi:uncharacterized protein